MAPGEFFSEGRRIIEEKDYLNSRGFCYSSCLCLIILLWQHCRFFHMAVAGQERMDLKWENVGTCWGEVGITLGARLWDLGSGIWDLVSQIKDLGSGLWALVPWAQGSGIRVQGSGIWDLVSQIWDLGSGPAGSTDRVWTQLAPFNTGLLLFRARLGPTGRIYTKRNWDAAVL